MLTSHLSVNFDEQRQIIKRHARHVEIVIPLWNNKIDGVASSYIEKSKATS